MHGSLHHQKQQLCPGYELLMKHSFFFRSKRITEPSWFCYVKAKTDLSDARIRRFIDDLALLGQIIYTHKKLYTMKKDQQKKIEET